MVKNSRIIAVLCVVIIFLAWLVLSLGYKKSTTIPKDFPYRIEINEDTGETVIHTEIKAVSTDKNGNLIIKGGDEK